MKAPQPPKSATWLLKHFGCGADVDVVMGDLAEHYQQGQTQAWYWKETLAAIIVTAFNEVRGNKWLSFRAVLVGLIVYSYVVLPLTSVVAIGILDTHRELEWRELHVGPGNSVPLTVLSYAIPGILVLLALVMGVVTGWIVARMHARRRAPILLLAIAIPAGFIIGNPSADSFVFWIGVAAIIVGILLGGLFIAGRRQAHSPTEHFHQVG
jgi:hypothetical protein